jgi:hypothetical protein
MHRKRTKYQARCQEVGINFMALAFDTLGAVHPEAKEFLSVMFKDAMSRQLCPDHRYIEQAWHRVVVPLQVDVARQILARSVPPSLETLSSTVFLGPSVPCPTIALNLKALPAPAPFGEFLDFLGPVLPPPPPPVFSPLPFPSGVVSSSCVVGSVVTPAGEGSDQVISLQNLIDLSEPSSSSHHSIQSSVPTSSSDASSSHATFPQGSCLEDGKPSQGSRGTTVLQAPPLNPLGRGKPAFGGGEISELVRDNSHDPAGQEQNVPAKGWAGGTINITRRGWHPSGRQSLLFYFLLILKICDRKVH